jgi:tol-pal system protein YbgF
MRRASALALLVVMLCASPLALAQRASLADRVAALEARAAADQGATELVNQISQLRAETQELRGQIEVLQQQLEQARQSQRTQYLDLDGRLNRLEGGAAPLSTPQAGAQGVPVPVPTSEPALNTQGERAAYDHAFDALKGGDYVESSRRFRDFLTAFPAGQLAPNALYWLGESYYVTQNYALAGEQFQLLMDRYPTHDKAPGALLKLGLAQLGLKQSAQAEATLRQVVQRYPGSDVARTADDRLRAMQISGAR